jgi:hypothetical protein
MPERLARLEPETGKYVAGVTQEAERDDRVDEGDLERIADQTR